MWCVLVIPAPRRRRKRRKRKRKTGERGETKGGGEEGEAGRRGGIG